MSRFAELLRTIPPATLGAIGVCSALYLLQLATDFPTLHSVTLCPALIVYRGQVYRVVTSALFHGSLVHIGMNMMSTSAVGGMLERHLGTLRMLSTMVVSIIVSAAIYITSALFLGVILGRNGLMNQHSVGFSGVVFHLSVLECNLGPHGSRQLFGMFQVPSHLYPWALYVFVFELDAALNVRRPFFATI